MLVGEEVFQRSRLDAILQLNLIYLKEEDDTFVWSYNPNGEYNANLSYKAMFLEDPHDQCC